MDGSQNPGGRGRRSLGRSSGVSSATDFLEDTALSADIGVYFNADIGRRKDELLNVSHKKRRLLPQDLKDALAEWIPVNPDTTEWDNDPVVDDDSEDVEVDIPATVLGKRKTYDSSTDPMRLWRPMADFFLDELVRHDGLADHDGPNLGCALCHKKYQAGVAGPDAVRVFKCRQCGEYLQCKTCCLDNHARTPLHVIQEWNGDFWVDISLRELGLVYQLGHGGMPCRFPDVRLLTMTVIDLPRIHRVQYRYCNCKKSDHATNIQQLLRNGWYPATITNPATCATFTTLETFRLQNVVANMNAHDFIRAIERQTNVMASTGLDWLPHRYKEFMRMSRQWAFLMRTKRAGRAHDSTGVVGTAQRELGVLCWACPHDKRNLPPDWRDVDKKFRFLYMLLVALDANFKLKNRMRANEHPDPSLGPGWGYFTHPDKYRKHLKNYVPEKDISTCIAFAALLQKDSRGTAGLRTSGVGGCVCARHECVLPHGIGDLQKGERFSNMDFILLGALAGFALLLLTISYDISCQWKVLLADRNSKMPKDMRLPLDKITLQCALPVWHATSHEEDCANANSLSFKPGVGKSDGEGVERTWSVLNPAAYHTKDMGKGNRMDTLEDKIDAHNHQKNLGLGDALRRKLAVARAERERQVRAFKEVTATVEQEVIDDWNTQIEAWLKDSSKPNPYIVTRKDGPTEAQVRLQLKKDEEKEMIGGKALLQGSSATAFLTAGLQIEQTQRKIAAEVAGTSLVAPDRQQKIQELRLTTLKKIATFRKLQAVYMPGAALVMEADEARRDSDSAAPRAENIKLYMPSDLKEGRDAACTKGLPEMEAKMRDAQCGAALALMRGRLHAKRHLITFRNENVTGQITSTKARTLIGQVGDRVNLAAEKYRKGRAALVALKGANHAPHYRELRDSDIQLQGENAETDHAAKKKLAMISAGRGARAPRNAPGESRRVMSWIWTVKAGSGDEEQDLHESVRVEWARAKARKTRWVEEVMILEEEMRRTLRYLEWQAAWWDARRETRPGASAQVRGGVRAYAMKQAALHRRLAAHFKSEWDTSVRVDTDSLMEQADLAQFFADEEAEVPSA
ncbi:hypothetical protein C8R47DRAFT_1204389 [Mycena vitilis]|nr:hypothetical protein C8R47DRAFT_1204389 [Mycena vitilis]